MPATFQYFPFDTGPGADSNEDRWYEMMQWMRTPGILTENSSLNPSSYDLAVTANSTLGVQVAEGLAWIQGFYFEQDGDYFAIAVNPNSSGEDRIDLLTLQLDLINDNIGYLVLEGTPSGSPVAPTPEQDSDYWQLPLAQIYVANGAVTITSEDITDERVISIQGVNSDVTLTSVGGESLVAAGAGPNLEIYGLNAGENVTLAESDGAITINATVGENVTLSSGGGDQTLVIDGTGPDLSIYGLDAGDNITITPESGYLSISASGADDVTLTSAGGDQTLISDGSGPDLEIFGLSAGSNISISESGGAIEIASTGCTLTSAGGTQTLVSSGIGPNIEVYGLTAADGLTISEASGAITIEPAIDQYCIIYNSTDTTIANGTSNPFTFDSSEADPSSMHNATDTNIIDVLSNGLYQINASFTFAGVASATEYIYLIIEHISGATIYQIAETVIPSPNSTSNFYTLNSSRLRYAYSGDYFQVIINNKTGESMIMLSLSVSGYSRCPVFSVVKLSN